MSDQRLKDEGPDVELEDAFKSLHQAEKTTDDPLVRVMALHALAYCERLFYLEEVEEIRVADANVYAGRRIHEELDRGPDRYTMELASERLGLRGKVDCVKRESGSLVVSEHKKGKSKEGKDAWPGDRLQVLAYALLLAEHAGEPIDEARIRYHADNKTVVVSVNAGEAEEEVRAAVERARRLRESVERPPVAVPERFCRTCSLAPVCLPEEERFAASEKSKAQRLFPAEEGRVVHVVEQGASVRKDGEQLVVYLPDGTKKALPGMTVSALVLHGNVQISTQSIHFCAARGIGVHWLSFGGHYVGALTPGAGGVQRKNRQFNALRDEVFRGRLAVRIAMTKVENQLRYILRSTRQAGEDGRAPEVENAITGMRGELASMAEVEKALSGLSEGKSGGEGGSDGLPETVGARPDDQEKGDAGADALGNGDGGGELKSLPEKADEGEGAGVSSVVGVCLKKLRGHEGKAGSEYFSALPFIIGLTPDDFLYFGKRSRRPPKDPFNALLSFGYALLYRDCVAAILAVGLEPSIGVFHTPRSAAYPLALDLMELFRVILWDIPLIGSVNRKQWKKEDFEITGKQVWLSPDGRRKAIRIYEGRKQEKWKHPVLDYSLSYARTIELEARLLEKEWSGESGLFGRLRLR